MHIRLEDETVTNDQTQLHAYAVCLREFIVQSIKDSRTGSNERAKQQMQAHQQACLHGLSIYARLRATAVDCTSATTVKEDMGVIFADKNDVRGTILEPLNFDLKAHYTHPDVFDSQPNNFECQIEFEVGNRQKKTQGKDVVLYLLVSVRSCLSTLPSSLHTERCVKWYIRAAQLRAIYARLQNLESSTTSDASAAKPDDKSLVKDNTGMDMPQMHLDFQLFSGGVEVVFELDLGKQSQRPHFEWLVKELLRRRQTTLKAHQPMEEELLQSLLELVPDAPIRVSARLEPCSYAVTTALPKDVTALAMRSVHHARLAGLLRLESSRLQKALMALRPATRDSWSLRETEISAVDAEVQIDTAEGKAEPSVCVCVLSLPVLCGVYCLVVSCGDCVLILLRR